MKPGHLLTIGALITVVAGWFLVSSLGSEPEVARDETVEEEANPTGDQPAKQPTSGVQTPGKAEQTHPTGRRRSRPAVSPDTRRKLLEDILAKIAARKKSAVRRAESPGSTPAGDNSRAAPKGTLARDYIQGAIQEIVPLIKECYEMTLEEVPGIAGTLKVQFKVVADEEYGGLITESQILDEKPGASLQHAGTIECVRESMYALRLKAPQGGGLVTVTYPFRFRQASPTD